MTDQDQPHTLIGQQLAGLQVGDLVAMVDRWSPTERKQVVQVDDLLIQVEPVQSRQPAQYSRRTGMAHLPRYPGHEERIRPWTADDQATYLTKSAIGLISGAAHALGQGLPGAPEPDPAALVAAVRSLAVVMEDRLGAASALPVGDGIQDRLAGWLHRANAYTVEADQ